MKSSNIVFPKKVKILHSEFSVLTEDDSDAGSFDTLKCEIKIGIRSLRTDPSWTWNVICHEVMELCAVSLRTRYDDRSVDGNYKFFMDHKEFDNVTGLFSSVISNFIKQ